jgi:hypothetical protein
MTKIQGSDGLMGKRKIAIMNIDSILNNFFGPSQEYIRRLRSSAIFSLQQQFFCMQNSYPIVTFCFFYMEFAAYHWLNVSCQRLVTKISKRVHMLNSVEKWLCESQKKKTVVDGAISI